MNTLIPPNRRMFLKLSGSAALVAAATGCHSLRSAHTEGRGPGIQLGEGDTGVLNYAYALEGLEAEFYTLVMNQPYADMSDLERRTLTDIRDHEIVHREFYRRALGSEGIPPLQYDFHRVNFNSRKSVLRTAYMFENTGVGAYNGAGRLLTNPNNLLIAGKIVSVEARHTAALGSLIDPGSKDFDKHGLDHSWTPRHVLDLVSPYIVTKISGAHWMKGAA